MYNIQNNINIMCITPIVLTSPGTVYTPSTLVGNPVALRMSTEILVVDL